MLPQILVLVLLALSLGMALAQHGSAKTGSNSVWPTIVSIAIWAALLSWGGFFLPLGW